MRIFYNDLGVECSTLIGILEEILVMLNLGWAYSCTDSVLMIHIYSSVYV